MKKITFLFLILISKYALSQTSTITIDIEDKKILTGLKTDLEGGLYIKMSKQIIMAKYGNGEIIHFDKDLNESYRIDIEENDKIGNPYYNDLTTVSPYGNYYYNLTQLINKSGEITAYKRRGDIRKESQLNPVFSFFNDQGYTIIGPQIGRKNYKKKYEGDDMKIWTKNHSDLSAETNVLETPNFKSNKDVISWQLRNQFKTNFYLLAKDDLNKEKNLDRYFLSLINYSGSLENFIKLDVALESDYFLLSKSIHGVKEDFPSYGGYPSYSGIKPDILNESIYAYGYYTPIDKKQVRNGKTAGFYVQKFNLKGELLWKKKYPLEKVANVFLLHRNIHFQEISKSKAIITYVYGNTKKSFKVIDTSTGEDIVDVQDYAEDYKENKSNSVKKEISLLQATLTNKGIKKKFISGSVIRAFATHPQIKEYIKSKKSDNTLYYHSNYITHDGSVNLIEFNGKERQLKLLKFK